MRRTGLRVKTSLTRIAHDAILRDLAGVKAPIAAPRRHTVDPPRSSPGSWSKGIDRSPRDRTAAVAGGVLTPMCMEA